jgi:hypothetical protein
MILEILNWSEIWAPVISLMAYLLCKNKKVTGVILVFIYILIAILLNTLADIEWQYSSLMPSWFQSNHVLYNIHSIIRSILFSMIFIQQTSGKNKRIIKLVLLCLYCLFVLIDFTFIQSIMVFSSYLFSAEGILLLLMSSSCLWDIFINENNYTKRQPLFWIAFGICIYEAANFFIFVFYFTLLNSTSFIAMHIWDFHNLFYIFLCFCLSKYIYENSR